MLKPPKKNGLAGAGRLSSGSTCLNLAVSGKTKWAFRQGYYYLLAGKSSSGKTVVGLAALAEACISEAFKAHKIIYDQPERGALMNLADWYGKLNDRLEAPATDKAGNPKYSETIQEFYYHLDDWVKRKVPFVYLLDSMDSLTSNEEQKKLDEHKKAYRKRNKTAEKGGAEDGDKPKGSYGDGKAKYNSAMLRRVIHELPKTNSILIIISQTRDNLGFGAMFNPETRSGGHALTYYATAELWFGIKGKLKRRVRGRDRKVGTLCRVTVKKNRNTGDEPSVLVPIYTTAGIDDVGGMIMFLVDEKHWKGNKKGSKVEAPEFNYSGDVEGLVTLIEAEGKEQALALLVSEVWGDIKKGCEVKRKKRY